MTGEELFEAVYANAEFLHEEPHTTEESVKKFIKERIQQYRSSVIDGCKQAIQLRADGYFRLAHREEMGPDTHQNIMDARAYFLKSIGFLEQLEKEGKE